MLDSSQIRLNFDSLYAQGLADPASSMSVAPGSSAAWPKIVWRVQSIFWPFQSPQTVLQFSEGGLCFRRCADFHSSAQGLADPLI